MKNITKTVLEELKTEVCFTPKSKKGLAKIEGVLASKIELKYQNKQPYYLAFFQLEGLEQDIPVIFRIKSPCRFHTDCQDCPWYGTKDNVKPNIPPKSKVLLTGQWAETNNSTRPSFTCSEYQILTSPPPITLKDLFQQISQLLTTSLKKQSEWKQRIDFLFNQRKELEEFDQLSKLGFEYLQAHLLLRRAFYSNYQDKLLPHNQFNQQEYLNKLASEIENIAQHIRAYEAKEL